MSNRNRTLLVLVGQLLLVSCDALRECGSENLLTMAAPANVRSFEIRDTDGDVLWKVQSASGSSLRVISLGRVPGGCAQTFPASRPPRTFVQGEDLHTFTVDNERFFYHHGTAKGPRSFCGGFYQSGPRKQCVRADCSDVLERLLHDSNEIRKRWEAETHRE